MSRKIHMQDQAGHHKVEEIMSHYQGHSLDMLSLKVLIMALFLLVMVYG
jgi:predicted nucleic acid-binding Zn ribbon protein